MPPIGMRIVVVGLFSLATCGCAHDPLAPTVTEQQKAAFQAARDQCGITVVETSEVQRCMRAKGFAYRLPWQ